MNTLPDQMPPPDGPEGTPHPTHGIGERLARLRAERGVKVSALARAVGVSPSLISQIERGQSRPSVSTLFELAQALDVPVDAFFRDDGGIPAAAAPAAEAWGPGTPRPTPRRRRRPRRAVPRPPRSAPPPWRARAPSRSARATATWCAATTAT
jgi:transcriptional regulator with XRE-family HTH domain